MGEGEISFQGIIGKWFFQYMFLCLVNVSRNRGPPCSQKQGKKEIENLFEKQISIPKIFFENIIL